MTSVSNLFGDVAQHAENSDDEDDDERSVVQEMREQMEEGGEDFQIYETYEKVVDCGRAIAGVLSTEVPGEEEREALKEAGSDMTEKKHEVADMTEDLLGNLPKFREAFPAEERAGNGERFHILPEEIEENLGIGRPEGDDEIVLPIVEGEEWTPEHIIEGVDEGDEGDNDDDRYIQHLEGIGGVRAEALMDNGYTTVGDVKGATVEELVEVKGIGVGLAEELSETESVEDDDEDDDTSEGDSLTQEEKALAASILAEDDSVSTLDEARDLARSA